MRITTAISLFICMFILSGCPVTTVITVNSIDKGSFAIPSYFFGKWESIELDGTKAEYMIRHPVGNKKGLAEMNYVYPKNTDTFLPAKVIMSDIDGKIYANLYGPFDDSTSNDDYNPDYKPRYGYYIYEFNKVSDREFTITGIRANLIKPESSSAEIIEFLRANKNNPGILDPREVKRFKRL